MPSYVEHEESRARLRYDFLARTRPNLLQQKPTQWDAANPADGITNLLEKELKNAPGGSIGMKTRALWRKCVRERSDLETSVKLRRMREEDVRIVKHWMNSKKLSASVVSEMSIYYDLETSYDYAHGPPGGMAPGKRFTANPAASTSRMSGVTPAATNSPSTRSQPEVVLSTRGKRRADSIESDAYSPSGSDDEILIQPLPTEARSTRAKDAQCPSRQAGPSSSTESAVKRPRLDDPTLHGEPVHAFLSTSNNQKTHHSKFFFPDGNVVLEVDDVLFKVYWYPLAQKSPYFTMKFQDLAKPAGFGSENIEDNGGFDSNDKKSISTSDVKVVMISGCPAYKLEQVSADEFAELLRLVYDGINYTPTSQSLLAIFRSSKRLEFSEYAAFAVRELDKLLPGDRGTELFASSKMSPEDALGIMKYAREQGLLDVLTKAAYEFLRGEDWYLAEELTKEEIQRLLTVQKKLRKEWEYVATPLRDPSCHSKECNVAKHDMELSIRAHKHGAIDPLAKLGILMQTQGTKAMCGVCSKRYMYQLMSWREMLWKKFSEWVREP